MQLSKHLSLEMNADGSTRTVFSVCESPRRSEIGRVMPEIYLSKKNDYIYSQYLVSHWDEASLSGTGRQVVQNAEFCPLTKDELKIDDMKRVFATYLDNKYGAGNWKMVYYLGYFKWRSNTDGPGEQFLDKYHIGDPEGTEQVSVERLKQWGYVGLYRPATQAELDSPAQPQSVPNTNTNFHKNWQAEMQAQSIPNPIIPMAEKPQYGISDLFNGFLIIGMSVVAGILVRDEYNKKFTLKHKVKDRKLSFSTYLTQQGFRCVNFVPGSIVYAPKKMADIICSRRLPDFQPRTIKAYRN